LALMLESRATFKRLNELTTGMKIRSVILPIILANIGMFMLQMILGRPFTEFLMLSPDLFERPYIILTSMFLHGDMNHIFFNMYGLFMFGPLLEERIGWKRFAALYLGSGLIAAVGHAAISMLFTGRIQTALGASGAIMGMIGALIILMPDLKLLFFFFIPMSLRTAGIIWAIMDSWGAFQSLILGIPTGIGNIAHLAGMATGIIYGMLLNRQKKKFYRGFYKKSHLSSEDVDEYLKTGRI
jgi:uncharacterized protein